MTDILTVTMNPCIDVSAVTEHIRPTSKLRCQQVQRHPGGGGINVARVLHRLGADCAALYPLGGSTGQLLEQLMEEEGVTSLKVPIAGHIRESFTVAETSSSQEYRFVLPGPTLLDAEWQACLDRIGAMQPSPRIVVGSGSLPPGVPDDFYGRLAQQVKASGGKFIVDTSGPALAACLEQGVFMVKPSLREIREMTGQSLLTMAELKQAALQWVHDGKAELVVVSMGEKGALMVTADSTLYAPALSVDVVSAVGAGDSFVAGMAWALASNTDVEEAFRYGVACGTAALMSTGTGLCVPVDVYRIFPQVKCTKSLPFEPV